MCRIFNSTFHFNGCSGIHVLFIILSYTHLDLYLSRADINSFTLSMHRWAGNERRTCLKLSWHCYSIPVFPSHAQSLSSSPIFLHYWGRPGSSIAKLNNTDGEKALIKFVTWTKLSHRWVNTSEARSWEHKPTHVAGADAGASNSEQGGVERSPAN